MKKISVMLIGLSSLICGCTNCDTKCENPWQSLLGENLSQADFDPQVWSIDKDGVISATKDQLICTKKDWQNFELELEFKLFEGAYSSGLYTVVFFVPFGTQNKVTVTVEI